MVLGARCPVMAVASAVATMCWILCLFLAGLAVRLRRRREVLGPVQEKMLWDTGGARCFWVRRSGLLCRPWRRGEERFRRRALSGFSSSFSGRPRWRGEKVVSRLACGGISGELGWCPVQGSMEEWWLREDGAMAVRVKRSSAPLLAADGICGRLHVWGGSLPGFRGGLAPSSPAAFGDEGSAQAMRRFGSDPFCCCCAGCTLLVLCVFRFCTRILC